MGAGAYGVVQLMAGGAPAASAVPADAVAYVSLDLDPSASQKIEAFKILRKFPAVKSELKLGSGDDLRKTVFEAFRDDSDCTKLDYARDVQPWIGNRVALAAVPDETKGALPLVVLQVADQDAARAGAAKLASCGGAEDEGGFAFVDDYMVIAETQQQADRMAADAGAAALADSKEYTAAMDRVGDPGIISMYVSPDAPRAYLDAVSAGVEGDAAPDHKMSDYVDKTFADFEGAAGVVRFADGAVEAEVGGKGLPDTMTAGNGDGPDVGSLPGTTAAAVSFAVPDGWVENYLEQMSAVLGDGQTLEEMMTAGEQATGLQLPEDVETLLGNGVTLSVDGTADLKALTESPDPTTVPAGIRIVGDPSQITPVLDKLKKAAGPDGDMVQVGTGDGVVALGLDRGYVDKLLAKGDLGSREQFRRAVPEAGRASGVVFVDFDAGDGWAEQLADLLSDGDAKAKANIAPLDALGISSWSGDDGVQHGLLRLSTD